MSQKKENWTQLLENSLFSHVLTSPAPGKYERRLEAEGGKRGEKVRGTKSMLVGGSQGFACFQWHESTPNITV